MLCNTDVPQGQFLLVISHVIPPPPPFPSKVTLLVTSGSHVDMSRHPLFYSHHVFMEQVANELTGEITETSTQPAIGDCWFLPGTVGPQSGFSLLGWLVAAERPSSFPRTATQVEPHTYR